MDEEMERKIEARLDIARDKISLLDTLFRGLSHISWDGPKKIDDIISASLFDGVAHVTKSIINDLDAAMDGGFPVELFDYDKKDLLHAADSTNRLAEAIAEMRKEETSGDPSKEDTPEAPKE